MVEWAKKKDDFSGGEAHWVEGLRPRNLHEAGSEEANRQGLAQIHKICEDE